MDFASCWLIFRIFSVLWLIFSIFWRVLSHLAFFYRFFSILDGFFEVLGGVWDGFWDDFSMNFGDVVDTGETAWRATKHCVGA